MYIVINNTTKTTTHIEGSFPNLEEQLNNGDHIIVISLYSNTIKVPHKVEEYNEIEWEWEDFKFDSL